MQRILLVIIFFLFSLLHAPIPAQASEPTPTPITYDLPYPGLLPDHPFYFLKTLRDNLAAFFISKPLHKASYALLQSDKHIAASYLLIKQKKNPALAHETFSQAQQDFEEALANTAAAKKEGMHTKELVVKLRQANEKHKEVLKEIRKQLKPDQQKEFQKEQERAEKLEKMAKALRP